MAGQKIKTSQNLKWMLLDSSIPFEKRKQMLVQLAMHNSDESDAILTSILEDAEAANGESIYKKKSEELDRIINALEEGPFRFGTFIDMEVPKGLIRGAKVRLDDGAAVFSVIPKNGMAEQLRRGDAVLLDGQARGLLFKMSGEERTGDTAVLERRIGNHLVEVSIRGERYVLDATQILVDALETGEIEPGRELVVCLRRQMAFSALPPKDGLVHFRYLDRSPVPNVVVERDIGSPPPYIEELEHLVRLEMTRPELRRRYRLPRCAMKLLSGISGSGKSFSLLGLRRKLCQVMADVTGVPMEALPPRVFRFRPSEVLSKWFSESDKLIARFFSEVEQSAAEKFITPDGRAFDLPVLAILEEIDGLTRVRGQDAIYDRILTTILELLDPTRPDLKDRLILFVATTNVAQQIDMAFLRRIGGTVERFGRLDRTSFVAVLKKHIQDLPLASENKNGHSEDLSRFLYELTSWLFSLNGEDRGQVALSFVGSGTTEIRYRRDFLTAGLVDRAVQQAASLACDAEDNGCGPPGVTTQSLKACFDDQIGAIIDQLSVDNVANYLELPEGARVQRIQTIKQPAVLSSELMRVM